jgi:hypothetical protein
LGYFRDNLSIGKHRVGGKVVTEQTADTVVDSPHETGGVAHLTHPEAHNPGRPISWIGTSIVTVGFVIGGIGFVPAPHWVIFWIGAGVAIIGLLVLAFSKAIDTDWY